MTLSNAMNSNTPEKSNQSAETSSYEGTASITRPSSEVPSPFKTTITQKAHFLKIAKHMEESGLDTEFVESLVRLLDYEGAYDLMVMWEEAEDDNEKEEIIADLYEEVEEMDSPSMYAKHPLIRFEDLSEICKDITSFKKALLVEVNRKGGISELSRKSGIPQPSLSRFFSSSSIPRQTTLFKIGESLGISGVKIQSRWTR